ncbi:hypothetical protein QVL79_33685, partial [Klebsiella pneumoniae]|nr:hypothetical protein [Klebsiella pneumoniae]
RWSMLTVGAIFSSCSTDTWRLGSVMIRSGLAAATASRSISAVPIKRISLLSKSTPVSWALARR